MAGSKRPFYYKAGDGNRYTTRQIDESNTETVNAIDSNEEKIPTSTHDNMPSGITMRYVRMYQVDDPKVTRKVTILDPATLAGINVNTDFSLQTVGGAKNFRISEFVGERRKLQPIVDTGQTDGDSDSALAPV
jgi:hypothetical protein